MKEPMYKNIYIYIFLIIRIIASRFSWLSGEPSPPAIHGQPGSGKSFKLSITKQDDGGAPILEYIVKYRSVSILLMKFNVILSFLFPLRKKLNKKSHTILCNDLYNL